MNNGVGIGTKRRRKEGLGKTGPWDSLGNFGAGVGASGSRARS